jgi:alpha-ketoglutarate-dependent taurine dioxygenase
VEALGSRIVLSGGFPYSIAQHKDNPSDCSDRTEYFDWHSDGLYHPHPPKYVLLHCLDAGSGAVVTELASSQIILGHLISEKTLYTLGKLRSCYIGHGGAYHHPILTIKGMLMASRGFVEPLPGLSLDEQPSIRDINLALTELYARLDHNVLSYDWKVGDTLIFNQYHYMHRRNSAVIDKDRKLIRMWFN